MGSPIYIEGFGEFNVAEAFWVSKGYCQLDSSPIDIRGTVHSPRAYLIEKDRKNENGGAETHKSTRQGYDFVIACELFAAKG